MCRVGLAGWMLSATCLALIFGAWLQSPARSQPATFQISSLLAEYPSGGPDLRAAITRGVEANPSLEDSVVTALSNANPAQQVAINGALSDCASYFAQFPGGEHRHKCVSRSRGDRDNDDDDC